MAREPTIDTDSPPLLLGDRRGREAQQRVLLLRILRGLFLVLVVTVTLLNVLRTGDSSGPQAETSVFGITFWIPLTIAVVVAVAFIAVDVLTPNKKIQTIGGVIVGLIAGMLTTVALIFVIDLIAISWEIQQTTIIAAVKVLLGISLCYLAISTVLQTQDDFRLVIPYVEFSRHTRGPQPLLLDTSALIDARIVDVAETGMIQTPLVVPSFVIDELQTLADSGDKLKRAKGRRGLEVVSKLQRSARVTVTIDETEVPGQAVDQMLVERARELPAVIATGDIALVRIAGFRGVPAVNIHELASAMRPSLTPGDRLSVRLVRKGEQDGQAVGYLDDGTMIVAEDGETRIGDKVDLDVRSSLQTAAGRMVFAQLVRDDDDGDAHAEPPAPPAPPGEESPAPEAETPQPTPPEPVATTPARSPRPPGRAKPPRGRNPRR